MLSIFYEQLEHNLQLKSEGLPCLSASGQKQKDRETERGRGTLGVRDLRTPVGCDTMRSAAELMRYEPSVVRLVLPRLRSCPSVRALRLNIRNTLGAPGNPFSELELLPLVWHLPLSAHCPVVVSRLTVQTERNRPQVL
ncbi:hypothetical protein MHYP_G00081770 [Metynnis hypsauchen]